MLYLTGVINEHTDSWKNYHDSTLPLGVLIQPLTASYIERASAYGWVGIDNGCFSEVGRRKFKLHSYFDMIVQTIDKVGSDCVLFSTAPDVPFDWQATLAKSLPVLPQIRKLHPYAMAAIVAQNGATIDNTPWDEFDCLFIGGDDEFKLGPDAMALTKEAKRRKKWVHMGRVNSLKRMLIAQRWGVDSADGTYLLYTDPEEGTNDIVGWLRELWKRARCRHCHVPNPHCLCTGAAERLEREQIQALHDLPEFCHPEEARRIIHNQISCLTC